MRNSHAIPNRDVFANQPDIKPDDMLVPTLHNLLGNLNPTDFCNVIRAVIETRADQHFEGDTYDDYSIDTAEGWVTFTFQRDPSKDAD